MSITSLTFTGINDKYFELLEALYNQALPPNSIERSMVVSNSSSGDEYDQNLRILAIDISANDSTIHVYRSTGSHPACYEPTMILNKDVLLNRSIVPDFDIKSIRYIAGFHHTIYLLNSSQ